MSLPEGALSQALTLMAEALEILDDCDVSYQVSPHLDLAICRLEEAISQSDTRLKNLWTPLQVQSSEHLR